MNQKYHDMWDGSLGYITVVMYRIYLKPGEKPVMQSSYRTGPYSRQFLYSEVERILDKVIIIPAQFKWVSTVVVTPKGDG